MTNTSTSFSEQPITKPSPIIQSETTFLEILLSNNKSLKIKNLQNLSEKIKIIKQSGKQNLCIVTDFDFTLSKHHNNESMDRLPSTFRVLEGETNLPDKTSEYLKNNYLKYSPLEMDINIKYEDKNRLMKEWWSSSQQAVIDCNTLTEDRLKNAVLSTKLELREGTSNFIKQLDSENVPLIIFSAGCGNVIHNILKFKEPKCWYKDNTVIVSNELIFDDNGLAKEFTRPLIYTMNKFNAVDRLKESNSKDINKILNLIDSKTSAIVMGDHLKDVNMANGMNQLNNKISIGFLNDRLEENLPAYMDTFDIVLVDDQRINVVKEIFDFLG